MTIRWECKCGWRLPLLCLERETFGETFCPISSLLFLDQVPNIACRNNQLPCQAWVSSKSFTPSKTKTSFPYQVPTPSPSSSLLQASLPPRPSQLCLQLVPSSNLLFLKPSSHALFVDIIHSKYRNAGTWPSKTAYDDVKQAHDKVLGKFVVCVFVWISRRAPEAKSNPSRKTIIPQSRADFECWWEIQLLTRP